MKVAGVDPCRESVGLRGEGCLEDGGKDPDVPPGDDGGTTVGFIVVRIPDRRDVCPGVEPIFGQNGLGMGETRVGEGPPIEVRGNAQTAGASEDPGQATTVGSGEGLKGWSTVGGERYEPGCIGQGVSDG